MTRRSLLLVANYESDVGYAWWLMESFWATLARKYSSSEEVVLAFPKLGAIPPSLMVVPITIVENDFATVSLRAVIAQARFIRRHQVATIYFTDRAAVSWRYALFRLLGVRTIIVHDHTPGARSVPTGFRGFLKWTLNRLGAFRASGLIGATEFVSRRHRLVNRFPQERCFAAPNGLPDRERPTPVDLHSLYGIPVGRRVVVSVGRASPVKGLATVIRAIALLVRERGVDDVHYLHLGDGPQLADLRAFADQAGIGDRVTLAGKSAAVRETLAACQIGIHASKAEVGYSLAILEFMEAGLPTVVSDDESVAGATVDGETGLTFTTGDPRAAADALERLLKDSALSTRLGAAAAAAQRDQFALAGTHERLLDAVAQIRALNP